MNRAQVQQPEQKILTPLQVTLIYVLSGFLWIFLSDKLALSMGHRSPLLLSFLSDYRGWIYVMIMAPALYWLLRRQASMHTATLRDAELMLESSVHRSEIILNSAKEGIFGLDKQGNIVFINKAAAKLLGYAEEELIAKPSHWIFHHSKPDNSPYNIAECPIHAAYTDGKTYHVKNDVFWSRDGSCFHVEYVCSPVYEQETLTGAVVVFSDISEHRKLEGQLQHAQKMESIGTLAGGIAHDFNNVLTAIIGCGKLLQMKVESGNPLSVYIDQILSAAAKAVSLTKGLLAFGRKQVFDLRPVSLNETVAKVEALLVRLIGAEIELRVTLKDPHLTVMADSVQLEQVLMNLATNARDAMPGGGIFTISTGRAELDGQYIKLHGYGTPGEYALITVSDTGTGLDDRTRERIFEPFFTTKETGKGTGLGLSIVYGIVKQHNGYINVYSEPGTGTTFKIYLPLVKESPVDASCTIHDAASGGSEVILMAEDEAEVRNTTRAVLEEFGYTVIEAADGEDAVMKFIKNRNSVQLLLLDVIMPKMNGKETYEEIKALRPDIKAIFTSGYDVEIMHKKGYIGKDCPFVPKPVLPESLLRAVRETLDT